MSQSARAEVYAHPDAVVLVAKNVDVVVAAADRAELAVRHLLQRLGCLGLPSGMRAALKKWVIDALVIFPPDAKTDFRPDLVHDLANPGAQLG